MRRTLVIALISLATPLIVSAHTTGASWNSEVGQYTVDVGYDPVTFTAGEYTRFDFLLWRGAANTGEEAPYAQIWVRITQQDGKHTVLATGIWHQPIGPTTLLYEFQEPGVYTLETSYRDVDGNDIAVASFPISVASPRSSSRALIPSAIAFIAGCCCGGVLFLLSLRYRNRSR
jgi:hypothetical protein